jgi:hypothetical protein
MTLPWWSVMPWWAVITDGGPPASYAGKGRQRQGARYVFETQHRNRRNTPDEFSAIVGEEPTRSAEIIRAANIKAEP